MLAGGLFCFMILEQESNYQFVHSAWHISFAVAILFLLPQSPPEPPEMDETDKYTMLNSRTSYPPVESSFKHYIPEDGTGPDVINVTSSASATILPPDQVIDVSRAPSMPTLHNGPGGISGGIATLPRSNLANRSREHVHSHGTLKKQPIGDETRPLITQRVPEPG